jgi:hypothetical protein
MQLAIIIPYFKRQYFSECIGSLAAQTNKNFKVYIGDDASLEDPSDILLKYKESINIIYHRFDENLGSKSLTKQWDRCVNLSGGEEWIMILGDDDYISSNYVEEFYENLEYIDKKNIKVIRFASRVVRSPSGEVSKLYTHPKIESATDFFYTKFLKFGRGSLTEQIFKKKAYVKHGFRNFPLGWGADNFAWLDFTEFGEIYSINSATGYFRISDVNISRGNYQEELKQDTKYKYFTIIIFKYLGEFKEEQRLPLLLFYEQIVYNSNMVSFNFWFKMVKEFIKEKSVIQIFKFTRRLLIYLFKR